MVIAVLAEVTAIVTTRRADPEALALITGHGGRVVIADGTEPIYQRS